MKHLILSTVCMLFCTTGLWTRTLVDGIYYDFDASTQTASVEEGVNKYSGDITIPLTVTYNGTSYSVTTIESFAFSDCTGLTSITIPNSVTSIVWCAFEGCTGLTSVTIPNSVTSIGDKVFEGCTGLTSITIPNSVTSIRSSAFYGCTGLTSINVAEDNLNYASIDGVLYSKDKKTLIECPEGKTGSVTIPNSVTSIGNSAFSYCTGLTSIEIPNSVTSIGNSAFSNCTGLTSINVAEDNLNYASIDGVLYSKDKKTLIECPQGKTGSVTIPNSVTEISGTAFYSCSGLTSVTIPNSVTSIGNSAFSYCTGLTSIEIPNSVTSIGLGAFKYCTGLTSITIPNSVTSVENYAFLRCSGLTSVTIPNSVTSIGSNAFEDCTGLTSITIPNSVTSIGNSAFGGCTGLTSMTVEATKPPYSSNIVSNYYIPLYVPVGSVDAYKTATEWGKFYYYIQAIPATGVNEATVENTAEKSEVKKIIDRNGIIYIEKDGTRYFLNGSKVK